MFYWILQKDNVKDNCECFYPGPLDFRHITLLSYKHSICSVSHLTSAQRKLSTMFFLVQFFQSSPVDSALTSGSALSNRNTVPAVLGNWEVMTQVCFITTLLQYQTNCSVALMCLMFTVVMSLFNTYSFPVSELWHHLLFQALCRAAAVFFLVFANMTI